MGEGAALTVDKEEREEDREKSGLLLAIELAEEDGLGLEEGKHGVPTGQTPDSRHSERDMKFPLVHFLGKIKRKHEAVTRGNV